MDQCPNEFDLSPQSLNAAFSDAAFPDAVLAPPPALDLTRLCIDGRLMADPRTGVCHYSSTLMNVLEGHGAKPMTLKFGAGQQAIEDERRWSDMKRWSTALLPGARKLKNRALDTESSGERILIGRDTYREARIYFKVYKKLMPLTCDGPPGIMHWTYPVPLYMRGWRNVYTVHDVIPLNDAGLSPISPVRYQRLIKAIAHYADRLITVSEASREEIIRTLHCAPSLVVNGSQAVNVTENEPGVLADGLEPGNYFLYCGSIEPRKNLERLVEAYRDSGSKRTLLITGPDGWQASSMKRRMADVDGVRVLPFQTRDRLLNLIRNARALLFPSLAEGFGLPVAEAMALGTPVMASSIDSLKEVTRGAALHVDPLSVREMSKTIARLGRDDELCDRLSTRGLARAMDFTPARYFERLSSIYADISNQPRLAHGR